MPRRLVFVVIALLALAAAAAAVYALLTIAGSTHTAVRRSLPEGRMTTVGRGASELIRPRGARPEELGMPPPSEVVYYPEWLNPQYHDN
jgi:hypothetical protein